METLKPETVWDLTIGYGDVPETEMPFDVFPVPLCFFRPPLKGGAKFNIHIRNVPVSSIPGFGGTPGSAPLKPPGCSGPYSIPEDQISAKDSEEQFAQWLRELWLEKERRVTRFYRDGWTFADNVDVDIASELYGAKGKQKASEEPSERVEVPIAPGAMDLVEIFGWCGVFGWAGWIGLGYMAVAAGALMGKAMIKA